VTDGGVRGSLAIVVSRGMASRDLANGVTGNAIVPESGALEKVGKSGSEEDEGKDNISDSSNTIGRKSCFLVGNEEPRALNKGGLTILIDKNFVVSLGNVGRASKSW
jgi:hypothetical protein